MGSDDNHYRNNFLVSAEHFLSLHEIQRLDQRMYRALPCKQDHVILLYRTFTKS